MMGKIQSVLPHCGKYPKVLSTLWKLSVFLPHNYLNLLPVTIHMILNISSTFLQLSLQICEDIPQILLQSNSKKPEPVFLSFFLSFIPLKFSSTVLYNSVRHASACRNASLPKFFCEHAHGAHAIFHLCQE